MRAILIAMTALAVLFMRPGVQDAGIYSGSGVELTGAFVWTNMHHTGDLDAVFVAACAGVWTVEFRFLWDDEVRVFRGSAEGSLTDGELRGAVVSDEAGRPQTFRFAGRFESGRFTGTHVALQADGDLYPTGTLRLDR